MIETKLQIKMAVIETKIASIEKTNEQQKTLLEKIDKKLDTFTEVKVDKCEFYGFRKQVNRFVLALIVSLVGVIGFLIQYTLFK